jgi:hypothetical protein
MFRTRTYRQFLPEYRYSLRKLFCELKVGELVDQLVNLMYPDKQWVYVDGNRITEQPLVNPKLQETFSSPGRTGKNVQLFKNKNLNIFSLDHFALTSAVNLDPHESFHQQTKKNKKKPWFPQFSMAYYF